VFGLVVRLRARGELWRCGSRGCADDRVVVGPAVCWWLGGVRRHVGVKGWWCPDACVLMWLIGGGGGCSVWGSERIGGELGMAEGCKLWVWIRDL
jgi:hypothetical protein